MPRPRPRAPAAFDASQWHCPGREGDRCRPQQRPPGPIAASEGRGARRDAHAGGRKGSLARGSGTGGRLVVADGGRWPPTAVGRYRTANRQLLRVSAVVFSFASSFWHVPFVRRAVAGPVAGGGGSPFAAPPDPGGRDPPGALSEGAPQRSSGPRAAVPEAHALRLYKSVEGVGAVLM